MRSTTNSTTPWLSCQIPPYHPAYNTGLITLNPFWDFDQTANFIKSYPTVFFKDCVFEKINKVEDHIHLITHLHQSVSLASLVKDIKLASSQFISTKGLFEQFNGWQEGYGAFTYSIKEKDRLIEYVKNQKDHHKIISFKEEFIVLLHEHGIEFDEKYLF